MALGNKLAALTIVGVCALAAGCVADSGAPTTPQLSAVAQTGTAQTLEEGSTSDPTGAPTEQTGASTSGQVQPSDGEVGANTTKMVPGVPVKLNPVARTAAAAGTLPRPGSAVYRCSGGGSMMIDNRRSVVLLRDPDGETLELPASPAGQLSRYGQKPYALVLDGNEALYVKPRKSPFTCKRGA